MTRTGLVGLFLLPLAFAALPLAAMAVSATNDAGAETPRIELALPDEAGASGVEVTTLGFTADDHLASDCSNTAYDASGLSDS